MKGIGIAAKEKNETSVQKLILLVSIPEIGDDVKAQMATLNKNTLKYKNDLYAIFFKDNAIANIKKITPQINVNKNKSTSKK